MNKKHRIARPEAAGTECVGLQIRTLRREKQLSLQQMTAVTGLSVGLLSQIERDISSPSVRALRLISDALGVEPIQFFKRNTQDKPGEGVDVVLRRDTQRVVHFAAGITKHGLTHSEHGGLELLLVTMAPGATSGSEFYRHPGIEAGYVISGRLKLAVEEEVFYLEAGDSFNFKSALLHRFENAADGESQVIWAIAAPAYV
jgi:quercetin dioxygenase-like cupin family protein/DNA-binding transcriptional regulator YiaG